MRLFVTVAVIVLWVAGLQSAGHAQTTEPTTVKCEDYCFEFTVPENCLVTYEQGGNGFSAIYNSKGGGKGTSPDYGLIVYADEFHYFSDEQVAAAGLEILVNNLARPSDFRDQQEWQIAYAAKMLNKQIEPAGNAEIAFNTGDSIEVPYYVWSVVSGNRKAWALTYVVLHERAFISVQVESSKELSTEYLNWLVTHLRLLPGTDPS